MSVHIKNLNGITSAELESQIAAGAKFVLYQYCVSIIIMTFRRPSGIYFIRADENPLTKGLKYSLLSFFFGWWGFPWGPIYAIGSLATNFKGGKDVTDSVYNVLLAHRPVSNSINKAAE